MKIRYNIEFTELINNPSDLNEEELQLIKQELTSKIHTYMTLAGFQIEDEIKLNFEMTGEDESEE